MVIIKCCHRNKSGPSRRASRSVASLSDDLPGAGIEHETRHLADLVVQERKARVIAAIDQPPIYGDGDFNRVVREASGTGGAMRFYGMRH